MWTEKALDDIPDIDFAMIWEDMCMKTGPLISPALFREFHLDALKRVTNVFKEAGVGLITLDSDGQIDELIPLWMEGGVDQLHPLEVASGCDPIRYRKEYG
jgi:uroporphyrinogen decarboxylase